MRVIPEKTSARRVVLNYVFHCFWNERLNNKCQLSDLEAFDEGWDYVKHGDTDWLKHVAMDALRADFIKHLDEVVTPIEFRQTFCTVVSFPSIHSRHMRLNVGMGLRMGRGRTCVTFGKTPLTPKPV